MSLKARASGDRQQRVSPSSPSKQHETAHTKARDLTACGLGQEGTKFSPSNEAIASAVKNGNCTSICTKLIQAFDQLINRNCKRSPKVQGRPSDGTAESVKSIVAKHNHKHNLPLPCRATSNDINTVRASSTNSSWASSGLMSETHTST